MVIVVSREGARTRRRAPHLRTLALNTPRSDPVWRAIMTLFRSPIAYGASGNCEEHNATCGGTAQVVDRRSDQPPLKWALPQRLKRKRAASRPQQAQHAAHTWILHCPRAPPPSHRRLDAGFVEPGKRRASRRRERWPDVVGQGSSPSRRALPPSMNRSRLTLLAEPGLQPEDRTACEPS